jgi:sulfite reductase (NADPH) flavoprotein alpha-component
VKLNAAGSAKDTRHFEFSLEGSGLGYEAGDALGVIPRNCSELVSHLIHSLGAPASSIVPVPGGGTASLEEALTVHYEVSKIPQPLLKAFAQKSPCELLTTLTSPTVNGELTKYLWGRDIIDLFQDFPSARFAPEEFVGHLKKLQPRLYSISSSPAAHPNRVHLTTAIVRYESLGRIRKGVCSTFLAERTESGQAVPVFVHRNKAFKLPADPSTPVIMVGPGTGIAQFRGFLHERIASGATGKSWLFFGDQKSSSDFLYQEELESFLSQGQLSKLCTAFSRDQSDKIYVQDRMLEHAKELFEWLEEGACFYVCGDASRMAKDVHAALQKVAQVGGGKSESEAVEYVNQLQSKGRYKRDVY